MKRKRCNKLDTAPQLPAAQQIFTEKSLEIQWSQKNNQTKPYKSDWKVIGQKRIIREKDTKDTFF